MLNHPSTGFIVQPFRRRLLKRTNGLKLALCLSIIIGVTNVGRAQSADHAWREVARKLLD